MAQAWHFQKSWPVDYTPTARLTPPAQYPSGKLSSDMPSTSFRKQNHFISLNPYLGIGFIHKITYQACDLICGDYHTTFAAPQSFCGVLALPLGRLLILTPCSSQSPNTLGYRQDNTRNKTGVPFDVVGISTFSVTN